MAITLRDGSPQHRLYQAIFWGLAALVIFILPFQIDAFRLSQFTKAAAFAVGVLALNLITGYTGQISLGHSAFVGTGAYTTAILVADYNWSYFATIPAAIVICFVVGVLFGLPALRIKGLYLALVTLSLATVFPALVKKFGSVTGGPNGKRVRADLDPPAWTGLAKNEHVIWVYFLVVAFAALAFFLAHNLLNSRIGRAVVAMRDNETGAAVSGVNLPIYKTIMFGISSAFAGVCGSLLVFETPFVSDTDFTVLLAIELITGLVVGGVATLYGAIPGGLIMVFVPYYAAEYGAGPIASVVNGILLIIIMFLMPGGILFAFRKLRNMVVRVTPRPPVLRERTAAGEVVVVDDVVDEEADTTLANPLG